MVRVCKEPSVWACVGNGQADQAAPSTSAKPTAAQRIVGTARAPCPCPPSLQKPKPEVQQGLVRALCKHYLHSHAIQGWLVCVYLVHIHPGCPLLVPAFQTGFLTEAAASLFASKGSGYRCMATPSFICGCWGFELRPSCLYSRRLTH